MNVLQNIGKFKTMLFLLVEWKNDDKAEYANIFFMCECKQKTLPQDVQEKIKILSFIKEIFLEIWQH